MPDGDQFYRGAAVPVLADFSSSYTAGLESVLSLNQGAKEQLKNASVQSILPQLHPSDASVAVQLVEFYHHHYEEWHRFSGASVAMVSREAA